jgi:hypothetical protein
MDAEYDYKASSPQSPGTLKPGAVGIGSPLRAAAAAGIAAGLPAAPPTGVAAAAVDGDDALLDLAQLEELHREAEKMKALGNKHMASQVIERKKTGGRAAVADCGISPLLNASSLFPPSPPLASP